MVEGLDGIAKKVYQDNMKEVLQTMKSRLAKFCDEELGSDKQQDLQVKEVLVVSGSCGPPGGVVVHALTNSARSRAPARHSSTEAVDERIGYGVRSALRGGHAHRQPRRRF